MFLPARCHGCGQSFASAHRGLCDDCVDGLIAARPFPTPHGLESCTALLAYDGIGRELIVGLKYRNGRRVAAHAARAMAAQLAEDHVAARLDLVTWAPTTTARRRDRGYDQAELLARGVARALARPVSATLTRSGASPQTGRPRDARLLGPGYVVRAAASRLLRGRTVLLVDDVATTGATLVAAADALSGAGAIAVHGAVLAHTEFEKDAQGAANGDRQQKQ